MGQAILQRRDSGLIKEGNEDKGLMKWEGGRAVAERIYHTIISWHFVLFYVVSAATVSRRCAECDLGSRATPGPAAERGQWSVGRHTNTVPYIVVSHRRRMCVHGTHVRFIVC